MRKTYLKVITVFCAIVILSGVFCFYAGAQSDKAVTTREAKQEIAIAAEAKEKEQEVAMEARRIRRQGLLVRKASLTLLIILIAYFLVIVLVKVVNRQVKDIRSRHLIRKNIVYFFTLLSLMFIVLVWMESITNVTVFLSIIGAGVALALQEVLLCVAGWFHILVRRPFEVGDRIELGGVKGDVIDIRLFQTSLLEIGNWVDADQSTGRIVNVPNSAVFKKENYNYNQGFEFIWNEIKIPITFESDWKRAEEIMLEHGNEVASDKEDIAKKKISFMAKRYMIQYGKLTPIVYVDIKDSGVALTLRYLTEARGRRTTHDSICRSILADFEKEENVNFAYPTYRIVK